MVTRAEVEQAKQDVQKAQSEIAQSKTDIQSYQQQISSELGKLNPPKRVPYTPRQERYQKQQYKEQLSFASGQLTEEEKKLLAQEQEIKKYQTDVLNPADVGLAKIEAYNAAVKQVERAVDKGRVGLLAIYATGIVRELAQKYVKMEKIQREQFKKQVEDFQTANPSEKLIVDWKKMKVTGVESGSFGQSMNIENYNKKIAEINKASGYIPLKEKLPAYYDPLTGKEVLQSIDPEIAKKLGYLPLTLTAYSEKTGKYIAESPTGLLTPSQEMYQKLVKGKFGRELTTPTTFEIGGKSEVNPLEIFKTPTSSYEAAIKGAPYAGQQAMLIDWNRLGPKGFYEKYGYEITPQGQPLYAGTFSPVINIGPTRKKGESLAAWYKRSALDKESAASALALATLGSGSWLSLSTKTALALNSQNIVNLLNPATTNKTKIASLKELALSLGLSALGGVAFGAAAKFSKDAITAAGIKVLAKILQSSGGSTASMLARNIAGLSLVGLGKATNFAIETYFKTALIGEGIKVVESAKERDIYEASLGVANLAGLLLGYGIGEKIGAKVFDISSSIAGTYVPTRVEKGTIKKEPSAIQFDILTGKGNVYGYRRGPIKIGLEFTPRLDKYLSGRIEQPTPSTFFRYEETIGVKGNEILPALSVPSFVQPPRYREMFFSNLREAKGNTIRNIIDALARTPVLTDVLAVGKFQTRELPASLRNRAIQELATTGTLSKGTQKELLNYNTLISDKLRELQFFEEQELVFRNTLRLKDSKIGFTRGPDGNILPVIYEVGTIKPRLNVLLNKKIITEQDAKFIQRQYDLWKKFQDEYVLPKQHSVAHSKAVMANVEKIILAFPEYHSYLIGKYGNLNSAIREIQKGAQIHDLGKTSESSLEYGTPHGRKVYNVYKAGLLPKEVQNLKPEVAQAIKTHETIAGTPRGVLALKYKVFDLFGRYSLEEKILATADRLDLIRYGMKIDPNRLPIAGVIERLKVKIPQGLKEEQARPREYNPSNYLTGKEYKGPYKEAPSYKKQPYNPINYMTTQGYKEPYKKAPSYKEPSYNPLDYITGRGYKEPYKKAPSYKQPKYNPNDYLMPKYVPPKTPYKAPPKRPSTPFEDFLFLRNKERETKRLKSKGKGPKYKTLPTLTQELIGYRGKRPVRYVTGLETIRII